MAQSQRERDVIKAQEHLNSQAHSQLPVLFELVREREKRLHDGDLERQFAVSANQWARDDNGALLEGDEAGLLVRWEPTGSYHCVNRDEPNIEYLRQHLPISDQWQRAWILMRSMDDNNLRAVLKNPQSLARLVEYVCRFLQVPKELYLQYVEWGVGEDSSFWPEVRNLMKHLYRDPPAVGPKILSLNVEAAAEALRLDDGQKVVLRLMLGQAGYAVIYTEGSSFSG